MVSGGGPGSCVGPLRRGRWTQPADQCSDTSGSANRGTRVESRWRREGQLQPFVPGAPVKRGILKGGLP